MVLYRNGNEGWKKENLCSQSVIFTHPLELCTTIINTKWWIAMISPEHQTHAGQLISIDLRQIKWTRTASSTWWWALLIYSLNRAEKCLKLTKLLSVDLDWYTKVSCTCTAYTYTYIQIQTNGEWQKENLPYQRAMWNISSIWTVNIQSECHQSN